MPGPTASALGAGVGWWGHLGLLEAAGAASAALCHRRAGMGAEIAIYKLGDGGGPTKIPGSRAQLGYSIRPAAWPVFRRTIGGLGGGAGSRSALDTKIRLC